MCINPGFSGILDNDIIAYKVVKEISENIFESEFLPRDRISQNKYYPGKIVGSIIEYKLNEESKSEMNNTCGIYCYLTIYDARNHVKNINNRIINYETCTTPRKILKVSVPKGSKYITGTTLDGGDSICVESIIPTEVVRCV